MIDQSEILSRSHVQFITLFFEGAQLCCAFHRPLEAARIWCRKTNFLSLTGTFDFFAINFTVWSHILCTGGDAVTLVYRLVMVLVQKNCLYWYDLRQYQAHTIACLVGI
jgi:hypothetical protein